MTDIYVDSPNRKVYLDVPVTPTGGTMTVVVKKDDEVVHTFSTVNAETDGKFSVTIPFSLTQEDASLVVHWEFDYAEDGHPYHYSKETYVNVITPILPLSVITALVEDEDDFTADEIAHIESATRHIIQSHTGQNFGKSTGTKVVTGAGGSALALPSRLISVETINGVALPASFSIAGEGWYLTHARFGIPPLKADYYGIHEVNGVIENPYGLKAEQFLRDAQFAVKGTWGWPYVPVQVEEAAKLLVRDYASGDTVYRDRYLTSMTAADWRIQFHSGAFQHTGNARADALLSDYVLKRGWAVI